MPSDENDHHDRDDRVEHIIDDRSGALGEERQETELNRVGDHGQGPRGEDSSPGLLHPLTLAPRKRNGQTRPYGVKATAGITDPSPDALFTFTP